MLFAGLVAFLALSAQLATASPLPQDASVASPDAVRVGARWEELVADAPTADDPTATATTDEASPSASPLRSLVFAEELANSLD